MGTTKQRQEQKFAANAALDRYLAQRPSTFLRRNLRVILDKHEEELRRLSTPGSAMDTLDVPTPSSFQSGTQLDTWNAQSRESLLHFINTHDAKVHDQREAGVRTAVSYDSGLESRKSRGWQDDPHMTRKVLALKRLVLRKEDLEPTAARDYNDESDDGSELGWIHDYKKSNLVDVPFTTCTVTIFHKGGRLVDETRTGTMSLHHGRLHVTFPQDLEVCFSAPAISKRKRGQLEVGHQPAIELTVRISNRSQHFASFIGITSIADHKFKQGDERSVETRIKLTISNTNRPCPLTSLVLDECTPIVPYNHVPWRNTILPKLDMVLAWKERPKSTSLSNFNRAVGHEFKSLPLQLPTPSASEDFDYDTTEYRITYLFLRSRRLVRHDLECPLCQRDVGLTTFTRLHLHLRVHHDYFDFRIEDDPAAEHTSIVCKAVHISVAEAVNGKANGDVDDKADIDWVAPSQPFDEEAYLAGTSTWGEPLSRGKKGRASKAKHRRFDTTVAIPVAPKLPPEKVPALNVRRPPLHPVPTITDSDNKQIQFYRTSSKKALQPGELVAESDEDTDDSWLLARQQQNLARLKLVEGDTQRRLTQGEQDFILDWNTHLNREQRQGTNGDRLKRDGIIRFARAFRHKLALPDWQRQFSAKLQRLVTYHLCDKDDVAYCLESQIGPNPSSELAADKTRPEVTNVLMGMFAQDEVEPDRRDLCVCGNSVYGRRGTLYCDNPDCPKDAFHMQCFDLKSRPAGWLCPLCTSGD